jgi:hypothetical protein
MRKLFVLLGMLLSVSSYAAPTPADLVCKETGEMPLKTVYVKHLGEKNAQVVVDQPRLNRDFDTKYSILGQTFEETQYLYVVPQENGFEKILVVTETNDCNRAGCVTFYSAHLLLDEQELALKCDLADLN